MKFGRRRNIAGTISAAPKAAKQSSPSVPNQHRLLNMSVAILLTDEEFLNLPESPGKQELLHGELIELPPAKLYHSEMAKRFARLFMSVVDESRVWIEVAYRLPSGWLVPDVSVSWPDQRTDGGWFQQSPMVAVEIISRGNQAAEVDAKVDAYLSNHVGEVWLVYPKSRSIVVFREGDTMRIPGESAYHCDLLGVDVPPVFRTPVL